MTSEEFFKSNFERHLKKSSIKDRDEIMLLVSTSFPWTGMIGAFFCNDFMLESVQLIKNSILVFEQGFFDAGFYFLRQSIENMNNMLLLYHDKDKIKIWIKKDRFPNNRKVVEELFKLSSNFNEIKNAIPDWFQTFNEMIAKANKYIHKQGYDTFYEQYKDVEKVFQTVNDLYNSFLKGCITQLYLIYIALNPIALLLGDEKMSPKIRFDLMDEPVPLDFLNGVLGVDLLKRIETTNFYSELKEYFDCCESLNYETELLIKYQVVSISNIRKIKEQLHLIGNPLDRLAFQICSVADISYVFFSSLGISPYTTDIKPNKEITHFYTDMFNEYIVKNSINSKWCGMFLNSFVYNDGKYIIVLSNDILSDEKIKQISHVVL